MYYPKSQITTNLYTNGKEYFLSTTGEPYKGFYYLLFNGLRYTGKNPDDGLNIVLTPLQESSNVEGPENAYPLNQIIIQNEDYEAWDFDYKENSQQYFKIPKQSTTVNRDLPSSFFPFPTTNDYKIGEFQRYFCKKTNELIYIEINKITYDKLFQQDLTIAFDLYDPISLPWNLVGEEKQVFESNKKIVELVERIYHM